MAKSVGKLFEEEIKASFPQDFYVERYKDDTAGFKGVSNPADFRLYKYPLTFLLELKSHKGKSIPIAKIRPNQIQGMEKATHYEGVYGGFLINFRELEETYYITVQDVIQFIQMEERKSIPVEWCRDHGVKIDQKKKRVRYSYDLESWLSRYYTSSTSVIDKISDTITVNKIATIDRVIDTVMRGNHKGGVKAYGSK